MTKTTLLFLCALMMTSTASAHTGMVYSSVVHTVIHLAITISIYLGIMGAGFYLLKKLPKSIRLRAKK